MELLRRMFVWASQRAALEFQSALRRNEVISRASALLSVSRIDSLDASLRRNELRNLERQFNLLSANKALIRWLLFAEE